MSKRDPLVFYQHMLDHSREAVALVQGKMRADIDTERLLNLALVRLLEIIGEAANRISEEEQARHPEIPWPQIVSLRNRLIHGYDSVDFDILWQIVTEDLPPLIVSLEAIVSLK
ncbi:MAG: DUF86 domain-containing protein [Anaerolineales bacterium]|nr:MAG: DUF86 domain-containing protein [Anaerolineales bacterium]